MQKEISNSDNFPPLNKEELQLEQSLIKYANAIPPFSGEEARRNVFSAISNINELESILRIINKEDENGNSYLNRLALHESITHLEKSVTSLGDSHYYSTVMYILLKRMLKDPFTGYAAIQCLTKKNKDNTTVLYNLVITRFLKSSPSNQLKIVAISRIYSNLINQSLDDEDFIKIFLNTGSTAGHNSQRLPVINMLQHASCVPSLIAIDDKFEARATRLMKSMSSKQLVECMKLYNNHFFDDVYQHAFSQSCSLTIFRGLLTEPARNNNVISDDHIDFIYHVLNKLDNDDVDNESLLALLLSMPLDEDPFLVVIIQITVEMVNHVPAKEARQYPKNELFTDALNLITKALSTPLIWQYRIPVLHLLAPWRPKTQKPEKIRFGSPLLEFRYIAMVNEFLVKVYSSHDNIVTELTKDENYSRLQHLSDNSFFMATVLLQYISQQNNQAL